MDVSGRVQEEKEAKTKAHKIWGYRQLIYKGWVIHCRILINQNALRIIKLANLL